MFKLAIYALVFVAGFQIAKKRERARYDRQLAEVATPGRVERVPPLVSLSNSIGDVCDFCVRNRRGVQELQRAAADGRLSANEALSLVRAFT